MNLKKCLKNKSYNYYKFVRPITGDYSNLVIVVKNHSLVDNNIFANMIFRDYQILLVSSLKKVDFSKLSEYNELILVSKKKSIGKYYYIDSAEILSNYSSKHKNLGKKKFFAWKVCEALLDQREDIK